MIYALCLAATASFGFAFGFALPATLSLDECASVPNCELTVSTTIGFPALGSQADGYCKCEHETGEHTVNDCLSFPCSYSLVVAGTVPSGHSVGSGGVCVPAGSFAISPEAKGGKCLAEPTFVFMMLFSQPNCEGDAAMIVTLSASCGSENCSDGHCPTIH
jgi:hypothetical protein